VPAAGPNMMDIARKWTDVFILCLNDSLKPLGKWTTAFKFDLQCCSQFRLVFFQLQSEHALRHRVRMFLGPAVCEQRLPRFACCKGTLSVISLVDINDCLTSPCGSNALCADIPAPNRGRTCTCNTGYTGNAETGCTGMLVLLLACHAHMSRLQCMHCVAMRCQRTVH
jgi:hypothetical protein